MQHLHDRQTRIQPDEIRQRQGAHGYIRPVLHDRVDVFFRAHARLETDDGLVDIRHQDPVGQEARGVAGLGGDLAHALHELEGRGEGGIGGLQAGDDLDALLDGDGVHEVRGDDARGGAEVGWVVGVGGAGDFGDGDARGVGGEDGVRGADLCELAEDGGFQRGDLGDGFDHEVYVREGGEVRGGMEAGAGC